MMYDELFWGMGWMHDDMVSASELVADGQSYAPLRWQRDPPGGHHRKGSLSFPCRSELPEVVEVRIKGNGGGAARTLAGKFNRDV